MRKFTSLLVVTLFIFGSAVFASPSSAALGSSFSSPKGYASAQTKKKKKKKRSRYIMGPRGGCYYRSGKNKVYVAKSLCR